MVYKKTHTSKKAMKDHIDKIEKRGGIYRIKGNTIEYGFIKKSKDTSVNSTDTVDLIMEAAIKGYKKVKVVFVKVKLSDYPEDIRHIELVKKMVGTQRTEIFDVIEEASDIVKLVKNPAVEKMNFV
jgi:hypothetical protein